MQIPLIKGDRVDSNVDYRDALPVNMYVVEKEIKGAKGYLNQWFGISSFGGGQGIDRGGRWVTAEGLAGHYRVSGSKLILVTTSGSVSVLGDVGSGGQASIAFSFNNVAVVSAGNLFYYNPALGLRQITTTVIGDPIDIVFGDGLFILTDGTDIYHSDPLDEENFDPLDFGNAQFRPDPSSGLGINEDNELIVFGITSTEYFTNRGLDNFIYQRIPLKALKLGTIATHARKEMNGRWYVAGRREETSPSVHVIQGGSETVIATREIEQILKGFTQEQLDSTTIDAVVIDKVKMVIIHLPSITLLFNESAAEVFGINYAWSILKSDASGDRTYRAKNFVLDNLTAKWVAGDKFNSNLGVIDETIATHYGEVAEWLLFTPLINMESLSVDIFEVETIPGFVIDDDATCFLSQTSNGLTYGKEEVQLYSANFDYESRFYVRSLGYVREYVSYKLRGASRSRMSFCLLNIEAS